MKSNLLSSPPLHSKLKKIQGLFKDLHTNSRTFQGKMEFKDFSRTPPKIQGLFKTVRTLGTHIASHFDPFKLKEEAYSRAVGDDEEASMTSWESEMCKLSPTFLFWDTIMLICAPLKYWKSLFISSFLLII